MNNNNKKILNEVDLLSGLGIAAAGAGLGYAAKKGFDAYKAYKKRKEAERRAQTPSAIARREAVQANKKLVPADGHDVIPGTDIKLNATLLGKINSHAQRQRQELFDMLNIVSRDDMQFARRLADRVNQVWPKHETHDFLPHGENGLVERAKIHADMMEEIKQKFPHLFNAPKVESYSYNISTKDPSVKMLMERLNYHLRN